MKEDLLDKHFRQGKRFLQDDSLDRALRSFGKAYKGNMTNPSYMSYYGLLKALRAGEIGLGLELCTMAIKKEFYKAEFYLNLGRVYLTAGKRRALSTYSRRALTSNLKTKN